MRRVRREGPGQIPGTPDEIQIRGHRFNGCHIYCTANICGCACEATSLECPRPRRWLTCFGFSPARPRCLRRLEFRPWRRRGPLVGHVLVKRICGVECLCWDRDVCSIRREIRSVDRHSVLNATRHRRPSLLCRSRSLGPMCFSRRDNGNVEVSHSI